MSRTYIRSLMVSIFFPRVAARSGNPGLSYEIPLG